MSTTKNDRLFPLFVKLSGRQVVVVGGGEMALTRVRQLAEVSARVRVIAPEVRPEIVTLAAEVHLRPFRAEDLDGAWFVVAAATAGVNRAVGRAAEARRLLVNAVDDPEHASAYSAAVLRRGGVTVALSTGGRAPALAALLRRALEAVLPDDVGSWVAIAAAERARWKRAKVPFARRRELLLEQLLAREDADVEDRLPPGVVSLVGAGPGDPGLLTRRAAARLQDADVVLHDALVSPELLELAPRAVKLLVGKRAGQPSVSQEEIEALLILLARQGRRVVRLKCGDPFVFGRGGEEAIALARAGVAYEVVPGISSALSAPALAGIPVTHRGLAAGFAVVSGHSQESYGPPLDGFTPGKLSVVVLMGVAERAAIAARLLARGWSASTPAALLLGASTPQAWQWRGTLGRLGDSQLPADRAHLPGVLVIGAVAVLELTAASWSSSSSSSFSASHARTA